MPFRRAARSRRGRVRRAGLTPTPRTRVHPAGASGRGRPGTGYPPVHRRGAGRESSDASGVPGRRIPAEQGHLVGGGRPGIRHRSDGAVPGGAGLPRAARRGPIDRPAACAEVGGRDRRVQRGDETRSCRTGQSAGRTVHRTGVSGQLGFHCGAGDKGILIGHRDPGCGGRGGGDGTGVHCRRSGRRVSIERRTRSRGDGRRLRGRRCGRRGCPAAPGRGGQSQRDAGARTELPRDGEHRPRGEDERHPCPRDTPARTRRILLPIWSIGYHGAGRCGRQAPRPVEFRFGRQPGRCVGQRSAAVLAIRRSHRSGVAIPGIVRQSAEVRQTGQGTHPLQAGDRGEVRASRSGDSWPCRKLDPAVRHRGGDGVHPVGGDPHRHPVRGLRRGSAAGYPAAAAKHNCCGAG